MNVEKIPLAALLAAMMVILTMGVVTFFELQWAQYPIFGYDESAHALQASVMPHWKALFEFSADAHPMLYFILLRPFASLGTEPFYPRLLSVIPTVLTLPVLFLLLRRARISIGVALTAVVVLASAWSFLHLGILIRAYALTAFFELAGLWMWLRLLPGSGGEPRRWSVVAALALFSAAFWCNYSAAIATAAVFACTLLAALPRAEIRSELFARLRRYSGWPEWGAFFALHLLAMLWFKVGWGNHVSLATPVYLQPFSRQPDQGIWAFLLAAMRNEMTLFTPLFGLGDVALDAAAVILLATSTLLSAVYIARGNVARGLLALAPLGVLAILALLSTLGKYPFGGELRHQYVLFPFLLLLLPLALDLVWPKLGHPAFKGIAAGIVIAVALSTTQRSFASKRIYEAPVVPYWEQEWDHVFAHSSEDPVFVPGFPFRTGWANRVKAGVWYKNSYEPRRLGTGFQGSFQGWQAILLPWPWYQEYGVTTDDGGESAMIQSYEMMFDAVPDEKFMTEMRGVLEETGRGGGRVLAPEVEINADFEQDRARLRAAAACSGFEVTAVEKVATALLWSFKLGPEPSEAERTACHQRLAAADDDSS